MVALRRPPHGGGAVEAVSWRRRQGDRVMAAALRRARHGGRGAEEAV